MSALLHVTLVHARNVGEQQALLDGWLRMTSGAGATEERRGDDVRGGVPDERQRAVVVEGAFFALDVPDAVRVQRIAAACVCCTGQAALRVAITRSVRGMDLRRTRALLLMVSNGEHLPRLRAQIERGELGSGIRLTT